MSMEASSSSASLQSRQQILRVATSKLIRQTQEGDKDEINVDSAYLKSLRNEIRGCEEVIPEYVDYLQQTIRRSMSDTRITLLSIIDYFFCRSHAFRSRIVDDIQGLLKLVCETDPLHCPLPGPTHKAKQLKVYAIKRIKAWHEKFGPGYIKLQGVPEFLKHSKAMDFERASAELLAEQRRKEDEDRKKAEKAKIVVASIRQKYDSLKVDVSRHLTEIDMGLRILVPSFEDSFDQPSSSMSAELSSLNTSERKKLHGYDDNHQSISVVVVSARPCVTISEENEDLVQTVRDAKTMLDSYRSDIQNFIRKVTACACNETNEFLKELIETKRQIDVQIQKANELKLEQKKKKEVKKKTRKDSDSEDSDLEDVPEKELEDFVMPEEIPRHILDRVNELEKEQQPSTSREPDNEPGPSTSKESANKIPILPFGLDLKYWGEERAPVQIPKNNSDSHRFWRAPDEDTMVTHDRSEVYETRVFTFVGEERRSEKKCRTRLSDGRLCPRMDFVKCPIHGLIVDRDEEGFPLKEVEDSGEITEREAKAREKEQEEYMRDLEAATGIDMSGKAKKKQKKKDRYAPTEGQAVRQRLEVGVKE
ncbi:hypothetical protein WR25_00375 isoform D [Diploscapter pachys]|uniref:UV-stimulated scaffold protein A C-terminal domain-containing protein n=2 Tax=Diploscapter pachys TaxID=2018661 RepID=A0A2A2JYS8_9BILA|nr:hypothetical protein WR25_00375 isoform D [Diploscapter pachys]